MPIINEHLLDCIKVVFPEERFTIPFHVCLPEKEFVKNLSRLVDILQSYNVQNRVEFISNGLNGATVFLDKYVLVRPEHGIYNWGEHYKALEAIVKRWKVHFYHPDKPYGFAISTSMTIRDTWECDDGGC